MYVGKASRWSLLSGEVSRYTQQQHVQTTDAIRNTQYIRSTDTHTDTGLIE